MSPGVDGAADAGPRTVPDLVPARMVNEFTYCRRLFHLEWVQARWDDNRDTVEGRWHHRAVDVEAGSVPPAGDGQVKVARSVELSSSRLGLVAKIDLLEGAGGDGAVVPVDVKRGHPPDVPERSWEPERVQLCVQGLLLRDAGYRCERGVLYFAGARQRVTVEFDGALVQRTLATVEALRQVAGTDVAPPPLVDDRKCPRCSLVGICLPDETNALALRSASRPRRLVSRDLDARPLHVTEQGAYLGKKAGRLEVRRDREVVASARLIDVSQVCVHGNVQVGTQLLRELFAREVPVLWFSYGGWFSGMAHGLPAKHVELRRRQVAVAAQGGLDVARRVVEGKIRNCRVLLRRNSRERPDQAIESLRSLADQVGDVDSVASLLGVEGAAARIYFEHLPTMIRSDRQLPGAAFEFAGRTRRPPRDAVNCLLGFLYALLVKDLTVTLTAVGFDPYLGFYHRPRFGRPALALDLAEEFRPLIAESTMLQLVNNGEVGERDFVARAGGVALTAAGRRSVIAAYERRLDHEIRHPVFGYRITYRRVLDVQSRLLGAHLLGEVPEYVPFVTR